jgi:sulfite oxidase
MNSRAPIRLAQRLRPLAVHRPPIRCLAPATQVRFASGANPLNSTPEATSNPAKPPRQKASSAATIAAAAAAGFALALATLPRPKISFDAVSLDLDSEESSDVAEPELPQYRISEIRQHDANSESPWVIHGNKVYDITNWIDAHPGGHVILRAAGGSIDPYWDIFTIHKTQYIYDILAQYQIGVVHEADLVDGKPSQEDIEDPFANDPSRDPTLIVKTPKPCNAETPGEALDGHFLTPNELFYVRNHMWVPKVDQGGENHVLTIELIDGTTKEYTLKDLKAKFPKHSVTAVLQCSGNRRKDMSEGSGRKANGLPWSVGAISNATWEGVRLADVLADAGLDLSTAMAGTSETKHVHFSALEAYGASVPIKKAIDPQGDVLLAYGMNGKTLPPDHGFPLRSIVPGHVAARSVKWLNHIGLSDEESPSQWQRRDYKCFGPNQTKVDWDTAPAIQELPVQSAITRVKLGDWVEKSNEKTNASESKTPEEGVAKLDGRKVSLGGYAYSGGGRAIIRVDVSLDDGKSWNQATLLPDCTASDGSPSPCTGHASWAWKRWRFEGAIPTNAFLPKEPPADTQDTDATAASAPSAEPPRRCTQLVVKATDEAYNTQPESHAATWNVRGNLATAWHRVQVCGDCANGVLKKP